MITQNYNPSPLEVKFVQVLEELKEEIAEKLAGFNIDKIEKDTNLDNPMIDFFLKDADGDSHEIILKVIEKPNY